jgi:outer membrane protein TolC
MIRARSIQLALAVTLVGASAQAAVQQQPPAPARTLTLDQALALARKANRTLAVTRAQLAQAATNIEQAWSVLFPVITAQGKYTHNYKQANLDFGQLIKAFVLPSAVNQNTPDAPVTILRQEQLDGSANATMPLIAPAAYPALESVKAGYAAAEANYQTSEDSVLFSVAQSFYAAAISDEVLVARRSNIDVARATLGNAKTRFAAGSVTKVDVDRAELALVRAEQAERDARFAEEQSYRALATLIQVEGPFQVYAPVSAAAAQGGGPVNPQSELDLALHLRPEFRALELSAKSADAAARAYGWRWAPTLSAFGTAKVGNYRGFTGDKYSWAVGAQLDWTLYDGGSRDAQRHLASAQMAEAEARAAVLRDSIRDDLANDRSFLDTKRRALDTAARSVELARETLDLVRTQYEAGSVTQVDLLQAQDSLVAAQEDMARAHLDVAIADLALRRAAGTFPGR